MRDSSWVALLSHIPAQQQDGLIFVTRAGIEITINNILRIEHEFFAFRGRLAGSQEGGRLLIVPYANIDYIATQKPIKDTDYEETYGNLVMPQPDAEPAAEIVAEVSPAEQNAPFASPGRTPAASAIKSAVLERFRSRPGSSSQGVRPRPADER